MIPLAFIQNIGPTQLILVLLIILAQAIVVPVGIICLIWFCLKRRSK